MAAHIERSARHSAGQPTATKCAKGGHKPHISKCMPGAGLSWLIAGRRRSTCQPSSRIGENPPYGMIGRVEETSASFEARSAPRLYPTAGGRTMRIPTATTARVHHAARRRGGRVAARGARAAAGDAGDRVPRQRVA